MSEETNHTSELTSSPEYIHRVSERVQKSEHSEAVREFLMRQFHVGSIDELLRRRGVYTAVAQIDILLDELEKKNNS